MSDELENEYRRLAYEAIMTVGMLKAIDNPFVQRWCTRIRESLKRIEELERQDTPAAAKLTE
jgi:hypothetical protein